MIITQRRERLLINAVRRLRRLRREANMVAMRDPLTPEDAKAWLRLIEEGEKVGLLIDALCLGETQIEAMLRRGRVAIGRMRGAR